MQTPACLPPAWGSGSFELSWRHNLAWCSAEPLIPDIAMVLVIRKAVKAEELCILCVGLHTFYEAIKLILQFPRRVESL